MNPLPPLIMDKIVSLTPFNKNGFGIKLLIGHKSSYAIKQENQIKQNLMVIDFFNMFYILL